MRKYILSIAFTLICGVIFGQTFNKGNILGVHVFNEIELQPGVTMEQVEDFIVNKLAPAYNESFDSLKVIPIKGVRGINEGNIGLIYFLESDNLRNKYWVSEGVLSEEGKAAMDKIQALQDEFATLVDQIGDPYTDWEIK